MRMQSTEATCGAAALSNALKAVGLPRSEEEMMKLASSTSNGTSMAGLIRALRAVGRTPTKIAEVREQVAVIRLVVSLQCGHPVVMCVDAWEHWVVAVGLLGSGGSPRIVVVDSASLELTHVYTLSELVDRWRHGNKFSGVTV